MEPLRGGWLVSKTEKKDMDELIKNYPGTTPAEFALRWAGSLDDVITVLSGMSNLRQMKQNVAVFENFKPMDQDEKDVARKIAGTIMSRKKIFCTGCKYCLPVCPKGIDILALLYLYNKYVVLKDKDMLINYYESISAMGKFEECTNCGLCVKSCPQKINIPQILSEIKNEYKKVKA